MEYKFNIDGKVRKFYYNDILTRDGGEGTMEELIDGHPSSEENPAIYINCYRDKNSDLYFTTSDGHKVMCKDAITLTPYEIIQLAYTESDGASIMSEMMCTMQKYGIGCIRFRINNNPLEYIGWKTDERGRGVQTFKTRTGGRDYKPEWVEYEAHAEFNRMPESKYKLHLYSVNNPDEHETHDFYVMDLNKMWIARPDYIQLTLGENGDPTGIYGKMSDRAYLQKLKSNEY